MTDLAFTLVGAILIGISAACFVEILRRAFQDGTELDIPADLEFAGLDEKEFRVAYDAFLKTQAELRGLKGPAPPLNSQFWRERGPG